MTVSATPPDHRLSNAAARGSRVTAWGILASLALGGIKVLAGLAGDSYALVADGIESLLDIVSALVVLGSLKVAAAPPNERHPYGYGKVEPLAALVVACILLLAASGIAFESLREIITPHHAPAPFTLAVLVLVVFVKEGMFRILHREGSAIGSQSLKSDAWHHRSDSLTSAAAFLGISVALVMGPGFESADDWAALFAAGVIAFNGSRLLRTALREVLDVAPSPELLDRIRAVAHAVEGVRDLDKCRVRRSGLGYFVDLHVEVDRELPVAQGHEIGHRVKDALLGSELQILDVTVHLEPHPRRYPAAGEPGAKGR